MHDTSSLMSTDDRTWAWGQILKDCENYGRDEAVRALRVLNHLGYDGTDPFMASEWNTLESLTVIKPHHFIAHLAGGAGAAIYRAATADDARREAVLDAGRENFQSLRPATVEEVEWHTAMRGSITVVAGAPPLEDEG